MPDGEMRRPPQLWEQRLARTTSVLSVGLSSGGDTTAVVPPAPPPGSGGGVEPAPVLPPPGAFIKPSTPQLIGGLQGINVLWDGLNSASELWPYDTSWVEVHMSTTGTAFTPGTATLKGRLARPGSLFVGGLTAGSAYYFKLRGADPAGNYTEASDAATGFTGLTTASDYGTATIGTGAVSFNARTIGGVTNSVQATAPSSPLAGDVWLDNSAGTAIVHKIYNGSTWVTNAWGSASIAAGQITALQIAAGAVTAGAIAAGAVTTDKLTAGTITGFRINGGTISGGFISGGTISGGFISGGTISGGYVTGGTLDGANLRTASSGARVEIGNAFSSLSAVTLYNASGQAGALLTQLAGGVAVASTTGTKTYVGNATGGVELTGPSNCTNTFTATGKITASGALDVTGALNATGEIKSNDDIRTDLFFYSTELTGSDSTSVPNMRANPDTGQIMRTTHANSAQRFKHDIIPLSDEPLAEAVDATLIGDAMGQAVDPLDVLSLVPVQYRRNESPMTIVTGFIAEDVEAKFPTAATYDERGDLEAIDIRSIVAGLLAVAQQQQATIADLTARIEALEA